MNIFLKEKNKDVKIYLSDPAGSSLYKYIENGELKGDGNSITEGIGSSRVTKNFEKALIDDAYSRGWIKTAKQRVAEENAKL